MTAGRQRVRLTETTRLIKSTRLVGLKVTGVEYDDANGKVRVLVDESGGKPTRDADDLDRELAEFQARHHGQS
jgi:hypothetical protein